MRGRSRLTGGCIRPRSVYARPTTKFAVELTAHWRRSRYRSLHRMWIVDRSSGPSMTALLHACVFDDLAGIRLFDSRVYVRRPVAGARITGTTLAAELCAPCPVRVVLADKA